MSTPNLESEEEMLETLTSYTKTQGLTGTILIGLHEDGRWRVYVDDTLMDPDLIRSAAQNLLNTLRTIHHGKIQVDDPH